MPEHWANLHLKRAYCAAHPSDGQRILVDHIWPRGLRRDQMMLTDWMKDIAPSPDLRRWFGHDPARWAAFSTAYTQELDGNTDPVRRLAERIREGPVTLVYAAKDLRHNHARVLAEYISRRAVNDLTQALMDNQVKHEITFTRLPRVDPTEIAAHMSDPRVAEHMPLMNFEWDEAAVAKFVATKEACWTRDGLGHWAILWNNVYVGWGGFQKEGDEWDYGLVLKPESFGLGARISRKAIDFAIADKRIPFVTFLLPPSRRNLGALGRLGAAFVGELDYDGFTFLKYRLETE